MNTQRTIRRTKRRIERLYDNLNELEKQEKWIDSFFIPNDHVRKRKWEYLAKQEGYIKDDIKLLEEKLSDLEGQFE